MADLAIDLARELVGKPFAWHGRGPEAYDCDICSACDKALEECGAKEECRMDESEVEA